ncbi:glycosyltransferase family 2 protein [Candidatus Shapirobacteria bacterium CG08_land_8_20_14_0_20_39_18]|uniref:Glycosyltransferase family 2 protein n=1 Tax=Candidatus Shapirobacteria bacterium CG08_land_8_20_14_0_20_39_18 TaxID=1974883 RepID=A0A2M6XDY8_9BACT|nr:MAG: glycosyltransferase family 2 protein [Candidatus Shapirobacteria bacterium CG08_land_8_20_14_0_20_39_18]PJE68634.1 MAG: glycosyltransferase family 2 protein [Candidatus Shapirobacteria bacterium CG10_big_fil_rev_8_21_14_0_10_38_8]
MSIDETNKKASVIILNWNGKGYIIECIDSVEKLDIINLKLDIVVVDNGSTDGSLSEIKNKILNIKNTDQKFKIIESEKNLGFTGGNNVGIKYALENGADYVMLLNSDTFVDKNLLVQLIEVAKSNPEIGIVGPKIYFAKGHEFQKDIYQPKDLGKVIWYAGGVVDWKNVLQSHRGVDEVDKGQYDKTEVTDFVTGCCMLIKKEILEKIGLLDNKYFLYLEDADFCQRAKQNGYKILYAPKAKLWHLNASSSSVGGNLQDYFITRNRLLFGIKYAGLKTKLALFREGIGLLLKGRPWQKTAVKDFFLGKFGKGSYGSKNN